MSNLRQGYVKTLNEWRFDNLRLTGTMSGSGKQILINKPNNGPVLKIGGNASYNNDLLLVQTSDGEEAFKIGSDGRVFISGMQTLQTVPMVEKSVLFIQDGMIQVKPSQISFDGESDNFGVGTINPDSKITLENGNFHIKNGHIIMDGSKLLDRKSVILSDLSCTGADDEGVFLGDPNSNDSWRIIKINNEIHIQKKIGGVWTTRQHVN
jgi:hypothetical protein